MPRPSALGALLLVALACGGSPERSPTQPAPAKARSGTPASRPQVEPLPGLPAPPGDPTLVAAATSFLAPSPAPVECGPYRLFTDLSGAQRARILGLCASIAAELDGEYTRRLGLKLRGPAAGTVVLFASRERFRDYLAADAKSSGGGLPGGYAGFSLPYAGLVVLPAGDVEPSELAQTLAHELSHLAHRRAFGRELPRWLSEGLADAIGDSATTDGFLPLADLAPLAGIRRRLCGGYEIGRAGTAARLVELGHGEFDRDAVSFDYEQSALLVRFLLLDPELGEHFRRWLAALARDPTEAADLARALATSWPALEQRFTVWLDCTKGRARASSQAERLQ